MSDAIKLQAVEVKTEIKRIKKLPKDEREKQMDALHDRIKAEIDAYYDEISTMALSEQNSEYLRVYRCVTAHKLKWELELLYYLSGKRKEWECEQDTNKNESRNVIKKVKTAHVSGLPLPEQAEVHIWWKDDKLIFASAANEFSLPVERVMGMGTTRESTSSNFSGLKTYLTIEYKKMK